MRSRDYKPRIAVTAGSPRGIGPEVALSSFQILKSKYDIQIFGLCGDRDPRSFDKKEAGQISFDALEEALPKVVNGSFDALVTCPINKNDWQAAGIPFTGHTEYLAARTGTSEYAMMLASPALKVTLATIHIPFKNIPEELTSEKIINAAKLTSDTLKKYFNISDPKIAVAGLNPHAGDSGLFGKEEELIILPAIKKLFEQGFNMSGPFSADTIFYLASKGDYDAVIALYHDQGLIAIKTLDFTGTVNITLGLPIIRTSVDHGTAEDIARTGQADDRNMIAAVEMAAKMAERKE